jgi:hypothetical protein
MNLWWIDLSDVCAGIFVNDEKIVVKAAPVFAWMHGKDLDSVQRWVGNKQGTMQQAT